MKLNVWLVIAFLFATGAILGWCLEVLFRKFISKKNPERKWLNPGFCLGPYLPLYGFGLTALFLLSYIGDEVGYGETFVSKIVLFFIMALIMTFIELIAGLLCVNVFKVRLWDYRKEWGNFKGIICPKFTFLWTLLSAAYYFILQPKVINWVVWLSQHLTFSFFVGLFYGIFIIDVIVSSGMAVKMRKYAKENDVIVEQGTRPNNDSGLFKGLLNFLYNSRVGAKKK